jgi:3-hydroxybutyryl-CoA dehydrogenase
MSLICKKMGMKLVVIGDEASQEEMKSREWPPGHEWIWLEESGDPSVITDGDAYIDLGFVMEEDRMDRLARLFPRPVLINSVIHSLEEIGRPFIRISAWPGFLRRPLAEIAIRDQEQEKQVKPFFDSLNWPYEVVADIPGMISARVIAMIINEAYYTFQEKTSTKAEIDIAMKLGTHYPRGPFEWSAEIGIRNIYELLLLLSQSNPWYGVARYLEMEALGIKNQPDGNHRKIITGE